MSTIVFRVIEYKKDDKWQLVKWYVPYSNTEYHNKDEEVYILPNDEKVCKRAILMDNPCDFRDYFLGNGMFNKNNKINCNGFPDDMSDETKKIVPSEDDMYYHSKTYYTIPMLNELLTKAKAERNNELGKLDEKRLLYKIRFAIGKEPKKGTNEYKELKEDEEYDEETKEYYNTKVECIENEIELIRSIVEEMDFDSFFKDEKIRVICWLS